MKTLYKCFAYGGVQPQGYPKVTVGGYPNAPIGEAFVQGYPWVTS